MAIQTAASEQLAHLDAFTGVWHTEGELHDPSGQRLRFRATDTYEWLAGGHFLLHHFDADMPDGKVAGLEVIGYDERNQSYPMHSFDSHGNATLMQARLEEGIWTFNGDGVRFTGAFRDGGNGFAGVWELRTPESTWQPWMRVELKKTS